MSDKEIIEAILKGEHSKALEKLYQNYSAFRNSFKKLGGNISDADDIFQDALVILIQKLSNEQFILSCTINTFLFALCRNLSKEYFKKKGKDFVIDGEVSEDMPDSADINKIIEEEHKYKAIDIVLRKVGKKCMELLQLFYLKGLRMSELASQLGFKSETSAKTQKYKCIEKARNLTEQAMSEIKTELS